MLGKKDEIGMLPKAQKSGDQKKTRMTKQRGELGRNRKNNFSGVERKKKKRMWAKKKKKHPCQRHEDAKKAVGQSSNG